MPTTWFHARPPRSPLLAPFVELLWIYEGQAAHRFERAMPTGAMQLLVNLAEDALHDGDLGASGAMRRVAGAALSGVLTRASLIDTRDQRRIAGVAFRPGAGLLLGRFAPEVGDRLVAASDLWPGAGHALRERLLECRGEAAVLDALERFLLPFVPDVRADDAALVAAAVRSLEAGDSVGVLLASTGTSERRLLSTFTAAVGTTPKRFARARRFRRLLARAALLPRASWATRALEAGYFDQAHMVREFRELSGGLTPTQYLPRSPEEPNHVPIGEGNVQDGDGGMRTLRP